MILQSLILPISATEGTELSEISASEEAAPTDSAPEEQEETEETGAPETVSPLQKPLGGDESSNFGVDAPRALAGPDELDLDAECPPSGAELPNHGICQNIDTRREPASLTKVMTCLLALEHGNLTDSITVSQEALDDLGPLPAAAPGLMAGEVFTLEQLLYCLMIESANDAAPVIAEYVAGSEPALWR